jgi:preprotein translocase SecE subunit
MATRRPVTVRPPAPPKPSTAPPPSSLLRLPVPRDIIGELHKVTWPTRHEATRLTILVIVASIIMGIVLGSVDLVFSALMRRLLGA